MTQATIKKGRKFDHVINGARKVFLRDGYEGASVDDISREAGVSKATLYSYFPDKRILFVEVARLEMLRQAETGAQDLDLTAPPDDLLPIIGQRLLHYMLSDFGLAIFRTAVAESERFPEIGRQFYESGPLLVRGKIAEYLAKSVTRGELVIEDVELAAEQFMELCKVRSVMCCTFLPNEPLDPGETEMIVTSAVSMFMSHYGASK